MTMWKHWKKKHVNASTIDLPRRPRHWYWDCTPPASQVLGLSSHCAQVDAETHQRKTTYYDISNIVDWNPSARIAAKLLPTPCRRIRWRSVEACMVAIHQQRWKRKIHKRNILMNTWGFKDSSTTTTWCQWWPDKMGPCGNLWQWWQWCLISTNVFPLSSTIFSTPMRWRTQFLPLLGEFKLAQDCSFYRKIVDLLQYDMGMTTTIWGTNDKSYVEQLW